MLENSADEFVAAIGRMTPELKYQANYGDSRAAMAASMRINPNPAARIMPTKRLVCMIANLETRRDRWLSIMPGSAQAVLIKRKQSLGGSGSSDAASTAEGVESGKMAAIKVCSKTRHPRGRVSR